MMEEKGEVSKLMMSDKMHLHEFAGRISRLCPSTKEENELFDLAEDILSLYSDYPETCITGRCLEPFGMDRDDYVIRSEQYMGFMWDFKDRVYQQFIDSINAELQEYCQIEEPTAFQFFDRPQIAEEHDQDFEQRLFPLLHRIMDTINLFEK